MVALFHIGRFYGTKSTTQKIMFIFEELYYSNNNGYIIYKCSTKCFYIHTFIFKLYFFLFYLSYLIITLYILSHHPAE